MTGLHPRDISAIFVTRGDVDLEPMLAPARDMGYGEIHVWDNSSTVFDARTFGRWLAAQRSAGKVWFFQDDDLIFERHQELLSAHSKTQGLATLNMPSPWYERVQDSWTPVGRPLGMFGGGSLVPRYLAQDAIAPYLARYGTGDLFFELCDLVFGTFMSWERVDLGFEELPSASNPNRICEDPDRYAKREIMRQRCKMLAADAR